MYTYYVLRLNNQFPDDFAATYMYHTNNHEENVFLLLFTVVVIILEFKAQTISIKVS